MKLDTLKEYLENGEYFVTLGATIPQVRLMEKENSIEKEIPIHSNSNSLSNSKKRKIEKIKPIENYENLSKEQLIKILKQKKKSKSNGSSIGTPFPFLIWIHFLIISLLQQIKFVFLFF